MNTEHLDLALREVTLELLASGMRPSDVNLHVIYEQERLKRLDFLRQSLESAETHCSCLRAKIAALEAK